MPRISPLTLLYPIATLLALLPATGPISDIDAYWHVMIGDEIRQDRRVTGVGDTWAWFDPPEPWTTSQWLSEVLMSGLVRQWGWASLVVATVVLAGLTLGLLAWVLRQHGGPRTSALLYFTLALSFAYYFQSRPLIFSLIGTVAVGHQAARTLREGVLPPLWAYPLIALWANLHGQWILAPVAIGLAAALHWASAAPPRSRFIGRAAGSVIAMLVAGCLTPLGIEGIVLPLTMRGATSHLAEWQPTELWNLTSIPLLIVVAVILMGWVRSPRPTSWTEIVYVVVWIAFAMMAVRNVFVAALLLAPLASRQAAVLWPPPDTWPVGREAMMLRIAVWTGWFIAGVSLATSLAATAPLDEARPLKIAEYLSEKGFSGRVLNDYNVAGVLIAFGPSSLEIGIDGRAERYGAEYIRLYSDTIALEGREWPEFLDSFDPESAVVDPESSIYHLLVDDWGWRNLMTDGDFVLLAPSSTE